MASKNLMSGVQLEDDKSLATSFNTSAIPVDMLDRIGLHVVTASVTDNTGTFKIQHRMRNNSGQQSGWADLTLSGTITLANADASFLISLTTLPPGDIRLVFTAAGGTPDGTCDIWYSGRGS